jgi:membrane AbrB-like protein
MIRLRRANPWFMGALTASMLLSLSGIFWSAIPTPLSNAAQLLIGVSLGVRFRKEFLHTAPRWLTSVAMGTAAMLLISALFGWAMAVLVGQHPATLILGTSPGGIAEMAITAKVLQLGVPVVTAFQVCRLVAVLVLVAPMFDWLERKGHLA